MNLYNLAISYLLAILFAGIFLAFTPPKPLFTLGSLIIGAISGILLSRRVVLPYLTQRSISIFQ